MELIVLKNGTRVALEERKDALSAAVNIFVASGSVCENKEQEGTAHFIEHMIFKGSENYTSREIAEYGDMYGGTLNAYTTKPFTCFFARALTEHFPHLLNILCDMVTRPVFDKNSIETEKGVVLEEIGMYEDSPEELGFDLLDEAVWQGSTLAHPILGTRESVKSITQKSLFEFSDEFYSPERCVISICGRFDRDSVLEEIEKSFGAKQKRNNPLSPTKTVFVPSSKLLKKDTEQTHIYYAFPGVSQFDKNRYAASVFSEIAGGGAASRLNMRIREELGLVYNTYCFNTPYLDCGVFGIWAALNHENQLRFTDEAFQILDSMREFSGEAELHRVKQQFKANMIMNAESNAGTSAAIGRQLLIRGRYTPPEETAKAIESVTEQEVREQAKRLFSPKECAVCVVGSPEKEEVYDGVIKKYL